MRTQANNKYSIMPLLPRAEYASAEELTKHQQQSWQKQRLHVMQHSEFYRQLWGNTAVPESLEDLHLLPLSDKSQLREAQTTHPPYGNYLAAAPSQAARFHRTSGTTGQAMNLVMAKTDCHITEVIGGRAQTAAGLTAEHTVVHCLNYQMWMGGLTDHLTLEQTGATVVPFGVGNTELLIRTILETGINAISCTPSYPAVLAKVMAEKYPHINPRDLGLKLGLFGGEPGVDDPAFKAKLYDTWGMQAQNANYGVTDVFCNFAGQCEHDDALHFVADDVLYKELIDPDTGVTIPMQAGARGELVLTHLDRVCQPLVRFRTGDIIRIEDTDPCQCDRTSMRFRVIGRSDDMIVVRGINIFPTMVAAVVGQFDALSGDYRILLDGPPPYDSLPIQAELSAHTESLSDDEQQALANQIEQLFKQQLGASAQISLLPANSFPTTAGKTQRIIRS
jgi:phenylacetate-CoA ligase